MSSASEICALLGGAAQAYGFSVSETQLEQLARYVAMTMSWARIANLTGASSALAFAREQVVDCLAVVPHAGSGRLLDVGSGNGLPGVVLAIVLPALSVTLLEPRAKRARFLTQVRIELGLDNVEVIRARVQDHHPLQAYDTVLARAFGALSEFIAASRALLGVHTRLLAMKGHLEPAELADCGLPATALRRIALVVPGYAERQLVVVEAGTAAGGFVP